MKLNDDTTQYLVDEIQNYYQNREDSLKYIFTLNQEIFGTNFYGSLVGDNFNSKVVDLVKELDKQGTLDDFIRIVRQEFRYKIFANEYVGKLLIQILNEIFTEEPNKFSKFYRLFISNLNISNLNISKKIKEIIPELETSEDIENFIKLLMKTDEEEDSSYVKDFVDSIIEKSSFQENQLREWSKSYIKDYNGLKKQLILKPKKFSDHFSNIFRKKIFFLKFIIVYILWLILLFLGHPPTDPPENDPPTDPPENDPPTGPSENVLPTDPSGNYIFVSGRTEQAMVYYDWIVTDKDSNGLNCRMQSTDKGIDVLETLLDKNYIYNLNRWTVITTFKTGTRLRPVTTQFGTNIFLKGKKGDVWVPVYTNPIGNKYYSASCFVRANKKYIKPVLRIIPSPK